MRDLLLWQDVYVWEGLGGAGGVSSSQVSLQHLISMHMQSTKTTTSVSRLYSTFLMFNVALKGSREGSESGEGVLADEIDKLQVN